MRQISAKRRLGLALLAAALLMIVGPDPSAVRATHAPLPPPEGEDVVFWGQFPDLVGTDIEFQIRDGRIYAFLPSMGFGFRIFEITDPAHPVLVGAFASPNYQNDIQVLGNLAVLSSDLPPFPGDPHHPVCETCGVFEGIEVVDTSDLTLPQAVSALWIDGGAHNATLIGSVAYISTPSRRAMDIVDLSDPADPHVILRVTETDRCAGSPYPCTVVKGAESEFRPHDITALTMPDKGHRLYVAAVESTFILDVNDPRKVRMVSKIPNGEPVSDYSNIQISHQSDPSPDGRLLVVSDERGGGLEVGCPGGGLHVYDITSEANPKKLGVYFAPDTPLHGNCTVHNFRFLPDRNVLVTAWYTAGSWVVDMTGPPGEGELDNGAVNSGQTTTWGRTLGFAVMTGADTWATKSPGLTPDGRLFMLTNDMTRGMDVLEYVGELPPANKK